MKINPTNGINSYKIRNNSPSQPRPSKEELLTDKVVLSNRDTDSKPTGIKKSVLDSVTAGKPKERINQLKELIAKGEYRVDTYKIADAILK